LQNDLLRGASRKNERGMAHYRIAEPEKALLDWIYFERQEARKRTARKVKVSGPTHIPEVSGKSDLSFWAGSEYFPNIYTLMTDELLISGNNYTDGDGPHFGPNQTAE
jgi:hypothetical protein